MCIRDRLCRESRKEPTNYFHTINHHILKLAGFSSGRLFPGTFKAMSFQHIESETSREERREQSVYEETSEEKEREADLCFNFSL